MMHMKKFFPLVLLIAVGCAVSKQTNAINPFQGEKVGCGNFIVYKLSEDKTQFISISLNASEIEFEDSFAKVDPQLIEIRWKKYDGDISPSLCNDLMMEKPELLNDQVSKSGNIEIRVNDSEKKKKDNNEPYKVTVTLENVVFQGLVIDYLQIQNVVVGWLPG